MKRHIRFEGTRVPKRSTALGRAALAGLTLFGAASASAAIDPMAPWPTANHDLHHTSRAPFIGPQNLKIRWTFSTGKIVWGPVVGRDGTIYVPSDDNNLYAIARDGKEKWRFDLGDLPCQHAVLGDDGTVYATGKSVVAITPDGKEKWRFDAPGFAKFQSPAFGPDGTLYQSSTDGTLYALDAATGKVKWSKQYSPKVRLQAPISFGMNGQAIISLRKGGIPNVFPIDDTGKALWSFQGPEEMRSATVADDGTVYVAAKVGQLFALDGETGAVKWTQEVRDASTAVVEFPALGADGTVYVGSGNGEVAAFGAKGDVKWRFQPDEYLALKDDKTGESIPVHMGTPIVDGLGALYVPSPEADLWKIGADGKLIKHLELPADARALFTRMGMGADGTLYSGSLGGVLYAFNDDTTLGDANNDSKVTLADSLLTLRKALGISPVTADNLRSLDVARDSADRPFGNGKITLGDAIAILHQAIEPRDNWPYPL